MSALAAILETLFADGAVALAGPPTSGDRRSAVAVLRRTFDLVRLDVAGPPIPFDADVALSAAEFVAEACWFLVAREEPPEALERRLQFARQPETASHHLSADLTLRYLPSVLNRARAIGPADPLVARLADVLRRWPLSGVLTDLPEPPLSPLDFADHPGLRLLYAERFARHGHPAWLPTPEQRESVELVYQQLGRPLPGGAEA